MENWKESCRHCGMEVTVVDGYSPLIYQGESRLGGEYKWECRDKLACQSRRGGS